MSYFNGSRYTFTWSQGRRLDGATLGTKQMTFTYNDAGLRTSKTVNNVTTEYFYSGSLLIAQQTGDEILMFYYDASGSPLGFQYRNGAYASGVWDKYIYEKNIQGDIVAIYNGVGTKLVTYRYDAWGIATTNYYNSGASTGAGKNPLTYRGYYYDSDLGFYYLQSRYYDAAIGRFINADSYLSTGTGLIGYNMYAYCNNNPVMYTDPSGHIGIGAILLTIGIVLSIAATAHDVFQLTRSVDDDKKTKIVLEENDIKIENSYLILTPWIVLGYSVYANHFDSDSKDEIQGSTLGICYEWTMHNIAAWIGIGGDSAKHLNVGETIFADKETHPLKNDDGTFSNVGLMSFAMRVTYLWLPHPISIIWDLSVNNGL